MPQQADSCYITTALENILWKIEIKYLTDVHVFYGVHKIMDTKNCATLQEQFGEFSVGSECVNILQIISQFL